MFITRAFGNMIKFLLVTIFEVLRDVATWIIKIILKIVIFIAILSFLGKMLLNTLVNENTINKHNTNETSITEQWED